MNKIKTRDAMLVASFLLSGDKRIFDRIVIKYMEDKTQKEISKITGNPIGTVKTHLLRGKEKLSKFLKAEGYGK